MAFSMTDGTGFIQQAHPAHVTLLHKYVHVAWLHDEGGAKTFLRKKLAMHKPPEHIPPVLPVFQRLSREKGDMNSFGSLHLL